MVYLAMISKASPTQNKERHKHPEGENLSSFKNNIKPVAQMVSRRRRTKMSQCARQCWSNYYRKFGKRRKSRLNSLRQFFACCINKRAHRTIPPNTAA